MNEFMIHQATHAFAGCESFERKVQWRDIKNKRVSWHASRRGIAVVEIDRGVRARGERGDPDPGDESPGANPVEESRRRRRQRRDVELDGRR